MHVRCAFVAPAPVSSARKRGALNLCSPGVAQARHLRVPRTSLLRMVAAEPTAAMYNPLVPTQDGFFGPYGGQHVPEEVKATLNELEQSYLVIREDRKFNEDLRTLLRDYVGRPSPLYFAERLTAHYAQADGSGPKIYLKREDLNHTGAHKINNCLAQALLAVRMGKKRVVAETGAGQHGVATATVCARFGLECVIYMGAKDMERQALNVHRMRLLGAEVRAVTSGSQTLSHALTEAIDDWVSNPSEAHFMVGSACGPHPYPMLVRDFQSVIGEEVRSQALSQWGGKPDILIACVGGGSNAMGLFHTWKSDPDVRLIGVEAAGEGLHTIRHAATLTLGRPGVLHGAYSYLLQDFHGDALDVYSISPGLDYPGVGPEHSYMLDSGRCEYYSVTDDVALDGFKRLSRLEGIIPALETSHAIGYLERLCPKLSGSPKIVVNCSGRGDKDVASVVDYLKARGDKDISF